MTEPPVRILGERVYSDADQQRFAAESRDFNPIHVDPVAARRLISGRQVVHGIHVLIQALDLWRSSESAHGGELAVQCNFVHPISVGTRVAFAVLPDWRGQRRLAAMVDGRAATELLLGDASERNPDTAVAPARSPTRRLLGALSAPLDEPPESLVDQCIDIEPWHNSLAAMYPHAAALLGPAALGDLTRLSFVVGMVCPGLHSVFLSLQFRTRPTSGSGPLQTTVLRYDPRYRLFFVAFRGAIEGELRAMRRPLPVAQPRAADLATMATSGSWTGRRALVIGGSRGLGETTAKLLAPSGCDLTITYANGRDDAMAVAADIGALGRGRCEIAALDLSRSFVPPPDVVAEVLNAVFYFATPRIDPQQDGAFRRNAFDEFVAFYVERFCELCLWLERAGHPVRVYLPSTTFITQRPKGMTEYVMAKSAAELLADDLNRTLRHVHIVHTRLPRLATDQTALVPQLAVSDNVATLLSVLQAMQPERPAP